MDRILNVLSIVIFAFHLIILYVAAYHAWNTRRDRLWVLVVVILGPLGAIAWLLFGPRGRWKIDMEPKITFQITRRERTPVP